MPFYKKTIFVLGAGASVNFNFPLGPRLVRDILNHVWGGGREAFIANGISESKFKAFCDHLRFADPPSVDTFLESNPEWTDIGRMAIAYCLMTKESPKALFPPHSREGNWYSRLAGQLGVGTEAFKENNLTILTYNYERSLEYYLTKVTEARCKVSFEKAIDMMKLVPFHYLHGSLGSVDPNNGNFREYTEKISPSTLQKSANSVRIIHEQSDDYENKSVLSKAIKEAEVIYFIGFGYHSANVRRLLSTGLREKLKNMSSWAFYPLRANISDVYWNKILNNQFEGLTTVSLPAYDIEGYLSNIPFETGEP